MTREQYDKSIKTGELQLSGWGKISYYFVAFLLFFVSLISLAALLFDKSKNFVKPPVGFIIVPAILGSLVYLYQKRGLKFHVIETKLSQKEVSVLVKKLCDEQKWSMAFEDGDALIAKTDVNNPWRKSKKITTLFDRNKLFVNSIYDPDLNKSGLDLFGNNSEVIKIIIDCLQPT
jgi:hypothetical protein